MNDQPIKMDQFLALVLEVFEKDNKGGNAPQVEETKRRLQEGITLLRLDRSKMSADQLRQQDELERAWLVSAVCLMSGALGIAAMGVRMKDELIVQASGMSQVLKN